MSEPLESRSIDVPARLNPATKRLLLWFAEALGKKLRRNEVKYGYSDGWLTADWQELCLKEFHQHIAKGDPIDVAIYCAFMWYRGWNTRQAAAPEGFSEWCLVEVMGHGRFGARVTEAVIAGTPMLRMDVPQPDGPFATRFYRGESLYCLTLTTEAAAWAAARASWPQPADRNTDEDDLPFAAEEDKRGHHNP